MPRWRQPVGASLLAFGLLTTLAVGPVRAQEQPLTLTLGAQNESGISGTATLTDLGGGKTRVVVQANGAGSGPQPSHIHPGSCAQLDPTPAFTLSNVVNGAATTDIDSSLAMLTSSPFAVHLHKSLDELTVYVACADISRTFAQYTVVAGDTLSSIAQKQFGDANLWPRIFDANRDQVSNPNVIIPGRQLRIPS